MRTTIDKAGRVVIPKPIRDRLALRGGDEIEIEEIDERIEISRPRRESELVRTEHGLLTFKDGPGLGPEEVRELIEQGRREREERW